MSNVDISRQYAPQDVIIDGAASADLVAAPGAGKRIRVISYVLQSGGAVNVRFQSGGATNKTGLFTFPAAGWSLADEGSYEDPVITCGVNEKLNIVLSAAVQVGGRLRYYIENV